MVMTAYCDNILKEDNTTLWLPSCKNRDSVLKLVSTVPVPQALREWPLHSGGYEIESPVILFGQTGQFQIDPGRLALHFTGHSCRL